MIEEKLNFLQSLHQPDDLIEIVNYCIRKKIDGRDIYKVLSSMSVNENNKTVSQESLLSLYKKAYDLMFKYVSELQIRPTTNYYFRKLKEMYERGELKPNLTEQECHKFYFETCTRMFDNWSPILAQGGVDVILNRGRVMPDFIHVYPFERPREINCRLYLNTTPDNSCKIGEYLLEECYKRHLRVYFKFDTGGTRNDSLLVYTNYEKVSEFITILEQIKSQHPELFVGATKSGALTAQVNDFISYGEEPEYKRHSSFNLERADAIDEFADKQIKQARTEIGNYSGTFTNSYGEILDLKNYLIYRLKESFLDTLEQRQANIKKGIFPKNINEKNVQDYIELETQIYNTCKRQIPSFVLERIEKNVEKIISDLKKGYLRPICGSIEFQTDKVSLSNYTPAAAKDLLEKNGSLPYWIQIDYDIQNKLFEMFGIYERIRKSITLENLAPYFEKHHCSIYHPHLNIETEQELNSVNNV